MFSLATFLAREKNMATKFTITEEEFNKAYRIAARIAVEYGEKYLPLFRRMEEERKKRQSDVDLKNIALQFLEQDLE